MYLGRYYQVKDSMLYRKRLNEIKSYYDVDKKLPPRDHPLKSVNTLASWIHRQKNNKRDGKLIYKPLFDYLEKIALLPHHIYRRINTKIN